MKTENETEKPSEDSLREWLGERLSLVLKLRESEKKTFKAIGEAIGTGPGRAMQLYRKAKWKQQDYEATDNIWRGLSTQAINFCYNAGLDTREKVSEAIKDGRLHPNNKAGCRYYGWKTHIEIHKWLGLPEPQRSKYKTLLATLEKKQQEWNKEQQAIIERVMFLEAQLEETKQLLHAVGSGKADSLIRRAATDALMHLETNYDINGNSMAESDAADKLRSILPNVHDHPQPES